MLLLLCSVIFNAKWFQLQMCDHRIVKIMQFINRDLNNLIHLYFRGSCSKTTFKRSWVCWTFSIRLWWWYMPSKWIFLWWFRWLSRRFRRRLVWCWKWSKCSRIMWFKCLFTSGMFLFQRWNSNTRTNGTKSSSTNDFINFWWCY